MVLNFCTELQVLYSPFQNALFYRQYNRKYNLQYSEVNLLLNISVNLEHICLF